MTLQNIRKVAGYCPLLARYDKWKGGGAGGGGVVHFRPDTKGGFGGGGGGEIWCAVPIRGYSL